MESSRESDSGAGWGCAPGAFVDLMPEKKPTRFFWNLRAFWQSRNDLLARFDDPTNDLRCAWLAGIEPKELTLDLGRLRDFTFLLVGDTGEGDFSQYALVPPLLEYAKDANFLFICSDVLYPIGDVNEYEQKFYVPYERFPKPIYAIPGNHDWYDGLEGFMRNICGREPPTGAGKPPWLSRAALRRGLWKKPSTFDQEQYERASALRGADAQRQLPSQRTPYFAIETDRLVLVGIDTGILKDLDGDQGAWLLEVSGASDKPKVLLTGTPIYVNNIRQDIPIDGRSGPLSTVDEVVKHAPFNYVAAIGGDIHNYQRYPVPVGDRTIQYLVSGGGGAFMHATHTIDPVTIDGVTEDDFKCYPLRRDSLAAYSRLFDQKLGRLRRGGRLLELTPDEAALYLHEEKGFTLTRPLTKKTARRKGARRAATATLLMPAERGFHKYLSPYFDWDNPPFFKNFLRLEVSERGLDITCYGVTGCRGRGTKPAVEDRVPTILL